MTYSVLFVDDEENILRSLKRLFVDEPVSCFFASSGLEGLEIVRNNEIAVVVSDQKMPGMSGAEFLEQVKVLSPNTVRIVLTGYADINMAIDAINKGGAGQYISKPWNDGDLIIAVRKAVETYGLVKENIYLTELTQKQKEELEKWNSELELYVQQQTIELTRQNQALTAMNDTMGKNVRSFISSFSNLIELRDKHSSSHSAGVASLVAIMAKKMGLNQSMTEAITTAAELHDIGKIGTPDIVLMKSTDELTEDETEEYRKHPIRGQAVVGIIEDLQTVAVLIRHHHENFDGSGFPDGLQGEGIPLGSRIIAMADAFDRISIVGGGSLDMDRSLKEIQSMLGKALDQGLFGHLKEAAMEKASTFSQTAGSVEVELSPKDLLPGMVVSREVRTGTGLVLMAKGVALNDDNIATIRRCYHFDPSKTGVYVMIDREKLLKAQKR